MDVLEVVRQEITRERLLAPGATVVVGVSGGPDSLCLLHLMRRLQGDYGWSLCVAHLNHRLRGAKADEDMVFVALLAIEWGLPCFIEVVDVEAVARRQKLSLEEAARHVRYDFLGDVAHKVGASAVAVGHNADDQSETVLMHFLRGSGLAGLRGMSRSINLNDLRGIQNSLTPPPEVSLIRPLLSVPRTEIIDYCRAHDLSPRFDHSNLDTTYFRNRLRHHLLPLLETYNPNIRAVLRRTAAVAQADYQLLESLCDEAWERVVEKENKEEIRFQLAGWRSLPLALRRATLRRAIQRLRPGLRDVDFVHVEQAVTVATEGETGARATLPHGLGLTVDYRVLRLSGAETVPPAPDWPLLWDDAPVPVSIPGRTALPGSPWQLETRPWDADDEIIPDNPDRWTAYVDAEQLGPHPALRPRRPGDRFQPLGMEGHEVKVSDWMVNAKVPRRWRARVPLLVHDRPGGGDEEIAWLVGWRLDERVKIRRSTRRAVRMRWEKSG